MQAGAEATWIEASRRGNRDAFASIIERYQRAVYAVAFSQVRDRALADDITQDTFVVAWGRLEDLRDEQRLGAWLCGIARNRARDSRKLARRETTGDVAELVHTATPYDALTEAESERIVAAALGQVPDVYREPLVLFYYEERSVDDVARYLGISAATTNKRLSRGRRYLADCVAVVERSLSRRGPKAGLAASVLAIIAVTVPASHVDASPAVKGSTMNKLALAALVTGTIGGVGALVFTSTRNDARASSRTEPAAAPASAAHVANTAPHPEGHGPPSCGSLTHMLAAIGTHAPSLAASSDGEAAAKSENDCAAVGRHLAELEADTTHGPANRPDDDAQESCSSHYTSVCESEGWSAERRDCTLEAGDMINAHLCAAGGAPTAAAASTVPLPANLACPALAAHLAAVVQGEGFHTEVKDLPDQLASACEVGGWATDLRTCFAAAGSIDALQGCLGGDKHATR